MPLKLFLEKLFVGVSEPVLDVLKQGRELQELLDAVVVVLVHLVDQLLQAGVDDVELLIAFLIHQ